MPLAGSIRSMERTPQQFMSEALTMAKQAAALGEVPVGAVIVCDGEIIARAKNGVEAAHDATRHAEIEAIAAAGKRLSNWRLTDCSLYVTMEPCPMCIGAILLSRIKELYFGCYDPRLGAVGSQIDLSNYPNFGGGLRVIPELLADQAGEIVSSFFAAKRQKP